VVGAEEEASEAEGEDGDAGALPAVVVGRGDEAEAEVDGVAWGCLSGLVWSDLVRLVDNAAGSRFLTGLHAHETAPDEDAAAVQESRDDVASQQGNVCPRFADVRCEVLVQSSCQGSFGILLARRLPEQCCALCIDFIGGESIL
jgi:hypothetical protein